MNKVYLTDYDYPSLAVEIKEFQRAGISFIPTQSHSAQEMIDTCRDADGLVVQYAEISAEIMDGLPRLKVISRYGVGVDTIDLEAATQRGICVVNVPDYCIDEVSNQAFALLLDCWRRVTFLNSAVHRGCWNYAIAKPIMRLRGQKLGLIGFGKIAREVAIKATPFGLDIAAYDPFIKPEAMTALGVAYQPLQQLLRESDIVSVHAPFTKDTYHLINDDALQLMKPVAILINTSRGPIVDEQAVARALHQHKIAGAGLDVLEQEPIRPDDPLLGMENVILTPHISWYSEESEQELKTKVAMGVIEVLNGRIPTYLVNKDVLAGLSLR